jgi:hypothetical protein
VINIIISIIINIIINIIIRIIITMTLTCYLSGSSLLWKTSSHFGPGTMQSAWPTESP